MVWVAGQPIYLWVHCMIIVQHDATLADMTDVTYGCHSCFHPKWLFPIRYLLNSWAQLGLWLPKGFQNLHEAGACLHPDLLFTCPGASSRQLGSDNTNSVVRQCHSCCV